MIMNRPPKPRYGTKPTGARLAEVAAYVIQQRVWLKEQLAALDTDREAIHLWSKLRHLSDVAGDLEGYEDAL